MQAARRAAQQQDSSTAIPNDPQGAAAASPAGDESGHEGQHEADEQSAAAMAHFAGEGVAVDCTAHVVAVQSSDDGSSEASDAEGPSTSGGSETDDDATDEEGSQSAESTVSLLTADFPMQVRAALSFQCALYCI